MDIYTLGRVGAQHKMEEIWGYMYIIADSLCYKAETNTQLWSNYTSIKTFKKKICVFLSREFLTSALLETVSLCKACSFLKYVESSCRVSSTSSTYNNTIIKFVTSKECALLGASLVAQWLRISLPMQGTRVRALVWEDPTCRGANGPVSHNCWACASGACAPRQERPR